MEKGRPETGKRGAEILNLCFELGDISTHDTQLKNAHFDKNSGSVAFLSFVAMKS
jgi:hypothetical protein